MFGIFAKKRSANPHPRRIFQDLLNDAKRGNIEAQIGVAEIYNVGAGVKQDRAEAPNWYRRAAEAGDARAQFALALAYGGGRGPAEDLAAAATWCRRAADQGHSDAQMWLGLLYRSGRGVRPNNADALKWTLRAADQGNAMAQHTLAAMLHEIFADHPDGIDIQVEAYMWSSIAHKKLWGENQAAAATIRAMIARKLTPEQIAAAESRARDWRPMTAADAHSAAAGVQAAYLRQK